MANSTCEAIIGTARGLIKEDSGSDIPALSDDFMILAVAEADREALRAYRRGGGNPPTERGLEGGNTLVSETAVNNAAGVAVTDVTIAVDSQSFPDAAGAAAIWTKDMADVYYYTSQTPTLFSGVTGIGFAHDDNDVVQPLYALPSNFGIFRIAEQYGDGVQLNGVPLSYMEGPPLSGHFSKKDDGTTTYLWLPRGSTGTVSYLFNKDSNTIDSVDDLVSLPDDWFYFYVWRTIEICLFGRTDYPIIAVAKQRADILMLTLLKDRNIGRRVRVRQYQTGDSRAYDLALREYSL